MSKINPKTIGETVPIRSAENKRAIPEKHSPEVKSKRIAEDKVDFSDRAATIGKLVEKLEEVPDIRAERVSALRDKIAANEYEPSGKDIADAIIKDEK